MGIGRKISIIAIILLIAASCDIGNNPFGVPPGKAKIKSEVKWLCNSVTSQKTTRISFKEFDTKGNIVNYFEYDTNGRLLSQASYLHSDTISNEEKKYFSENGAYLFTRKSVYEYSLDGRMLKKISYDDYDSLLNTNVFVYDDKGNLIKKIEYDAKTSNETETNIAYSYNNDGNVVERLVNPSSDGKYYSRDSLVYNNRTNTVEKINFDSKGKINTIIIYIYNSKGFIAIETETDPSGNIVRKYLYEYEYY